MVYRMLEDRNRYIESQPPHTVSGGELFALNFYPFFLSLASFAIGLFGCGLLIMSCCLARKGRQPVWTFLHIGSSIFQIPVFIELIRFLRNWTW